MLPDRKILVHKPVEVRNLGKKLQDRDLNTADWLWQVKYDGCNCIAIVRGGDVQFYTREGNEVLSLHHLKADFMQWPTGVYFGEAWCAGLEFPEISGLFRRQTSSAETAVLKFVLFDSVSYSEFHAGQCDLPFDKRWIETVGAYFANPRTHILLAQTCVGTPGPVAELKAEVAMHQSRGVWKTDGFIAKERAGLWIAGAGKGGEQLKVKDHISVDLKCVGIEWGKGKFEGMIGAVLVEWNGETVPVGGGKLTNDERKHPELLIGRIVEVHALGLTPNGQLREPRYQQIRFDKTEPSV
ncbi:hypothetical protein [Methanobrevibacter gottschalkii]|uniref:hypothetical protein n=1 Tax=Methanobrevibacter gottschalkii TaxID=190974 RepID=UPI0038D1952C